jgi:hypothetical protein
LAAAQFRPEAGGTRMLGIKSFTFLEKTGDAQSSCCAPSGAETLFINKEWA